jgi:hypothetical protein
MKVPFYPFWTMSRQNVSLLLVVMLLSSLAKAQVGQIPDGFKSIFNGKDLKGWHISRTTHQGTTPNFPLRTALLLAKRNPTGRADFY